MADWRLPFEARVRWVGVDPATWKETGPVGGVLSGGKVVLDAGDPVKASASVDVTGDFSPTGLVRCYADVSFSDGSRAAECLGTFGATVPRWSRTDAGASGSADLYGCLSLAQGAVPAVSVHVPAGSDPVAAAAGCLRAAGLSVSADTGPQRLAEARTYGLVPVDGVGDDRLAIARDLCAAAGFKEPVCDPMGRALLRRQLDDASRAPDQRWEEGPGCRFLPSMEDEEEEPKATCVKVVASTGRGSVVAQARDDAASERLGREVWEVVRPSEEMDLDRAQALADKTLRERLAARRTVSLKHIYRPVALGDVVDLSWPTGKVRGRFRVERVSVDLGAPGLLMDVDLEEVR